MMLDNWLTMMPQKIPMKISNIQVIVLGISNSSFSKKKLAGISKWKSNDFLHLNHHLLIN